MTSAPIETQVNPATAMDQDIEPGTLSDLQILEYVRQGWLITDNCLSDSIKQACYELRAGNIYYELNRADHDTTPTRYELGQGEYILLKPKQFITIITHESVKLPPNVLGRVLTKGQLFSVGVVPVNTYADPGFEGKLGIVLANLSNNYLKIAQLQPIAKIEFSKLSKAVGKPYRGQHGYQTQMWPVPNHMVLTSKELATDPRVQTPLDELQAIHGATIARAMKRVFRFERYLLLSAIAYFLLSAILLGILAVRHDAGFNLATLTSVVLGVISNVIFALLTYFATKISR